MRNLLHPSLLTALLLFMVPTLSGAATPDDWRIEQLEWTGAPGDETPLEVINLQGDLRVRAGAVDRIEVLAVLQRHVDDPRGAEISVREPANTGGSATETLQGARRIEIVTPDVATQRPAQIPDAWRKRRVDITVIVPAGIPLALTTEKGTLQAKGLTAPMIARSTHGDLQLVSSAPVDAHSDYGRVQVELRGAAWSQGASLSTRTGTIRLRLPHGAAFRAELETRGDITTDYSITIERQGATELKKGRVLTDPDGPSLILRSDRGELQILEQWPPPIATGSQKEPPDGE